MQFWDYNTVYHLCKRIGKIPPSTDYKQFYAAVQQLAYRDNLPIAHNQFAAEAMWLRDRKPYYLVYPSIIPMLTKLNLEFTGDRVTLPMPVLLIRLPVGQEGLRWKADGAQHEVRTILLVDTEVRGERGASIWMNLGEEYPPGEPIYTFRTFRLTSEHTIEKEIESLPVHESSKEGLQLPREVDLNCIRLAVTLCLLGDDPEIISPDVLAGDLRAWEEKGDQKYVEKARRRGKLGWVIGRGIEVIPHVRRPHPALVWTGKGREIPRIVMRKGSIVHRNLVEKLPTGWEGNG